LPASSRRTGAPLFTRRESYPQVTGVLHMKSLVTFPRSDKACWWVEAFWPTWPTWPTMDGGFMAEVSIKNQSLSSWSEADRLWAYYKQSQEGKAVVLLAIRRRVGFAL